MLDGRWNHFQHVTHISIRGGLHQAEAEAGAGASFVEAHRHQYVAWLCRTGVTSRSAGDSHALQVERDPERFAFQWIEPDVACMGHGGTAIPPAVEARAEKLQKLRFQTVAKPREPVD